MIAKASRRTPTRMDVDLTLRFRFGEAPEDVVTMLDARRVPMVNSVFDNRDRIVRRFLALMLQGGLRSPAVMRELLPLRKLLKKRSARTR
jgi:hypothetical protein